MRLRNKIFTSFRKNPKNFAKPTKKTNHILSDSRDAKVSIIVLFYDFPRPYERYMQTNGFIRP